MLEDLSTIRGGRVLKLFINSPSPCDEFTPKQDVLNIRFMVALSAKEARKSVRKLQATLGEYVDLAQRAGQGRVRLDIHKVLYEGKRWYCMEFHARTNEQGAAIYQKISQIF